jgi:formate hydrogenlyase subunit 6/NADH:ubiquinone oxidoreductase subunit I
MKGKEKRRRERPGALVPEMLKNLATRAATEPYPAVHIDVPAGFRGRIEISDERCIGCSKCSLVCPTECIEMVADERDVAVGTKTVKRKRRPVVHVLSCIRCGLCEESCPTDPKAIYLTEVFAGAYGEKDVVVR